MDESFSLWNSESLQQWIDIEVMIKNNHSLQLEEVAFKNETDLQQNLQNFLPPREVLTNTAFLMQDSVNIFELQPFERLSILKNVFNLIWIDDAKDILAEKKRELSYKIKASTDFSKYNERLQSWIKKYLQTFAEVEGKLWDVISFAPYEKYFEDRNLYQEKITISDFSLNDFPVEMMSKIDLHVSHDKEQFQKIQHLSETTQWQIQEIRMVVQHQLHESQELEKNIELLTKKITWIDVQKLADLKQEEKMNMQEDIAGEKWIPREEIWTFYTAGKNKFQDLWIAWKNVSEISLATTALFVERLKRQWISYNEEIKNLDLQLQNIDIQARNEKEKLQMQEKNIQEKMKVQEAQLKQISKTIDEMENNIETQATFACNEISKPCPFIKVINKKTFEQLENQKTQFLKQKDEAEKTLKAIQEELVQVQTLAVNKNDAQELEKTKKELETKKEQANQWITQIKDFLKTIEYKQIEEWNMQRLQREKILKEIILQIRSIEEQQNTLKEWEMQKQKALAQKESLDKQLLDWRNSLTLLEDKQKNLQAEIGKKDVKGLLAMENLVISMKEIYRDIHTLIENFKDSQLESEKLKEQETILGNLYTIVSKELLIMVLQSHLPLLNDIVNNFLLQVVDYQINIQANTADIEKPELEIKIIDDKWERDVKSLSGGQRIILKLVWMLAISSYINSPMLFLDETINNLDADTIGKVADMLEDFVKQKSMKLYTITHSQQIQQMDIWTKVVEIANVMNN